MQLTALTMRWVIFTGTGELQMRGADHTSLNGRAIMVACAALFCIVCGTCSIVSAQVKHDTASPNGYAIRIIHPGGLTSNTPMYGPDLSGMTNFSQSPP